MTLEELIAEARQRADDQVDPSMYGVDNFKRWANEGEAEACVRACLLYDDSGRFTISLTAGRSLYALDARILAVDRVTFIPATGTASRDLRLTGIDHIEAQGDWRRRIGKPEMAAHTAKTELRIWPRPTAETANGSLVLSVYRLPLDPMESEALEPEIPVEHHEGLVDWMLYRAYSPKDGELGDTDRAEMCMARFEQRFGERRTADTYRRHRERRRVTSTYGGY